MKANAGGGEVGDREGNERNELMREEQGDRWCIRQEKESDYD